MKRIGYANLRNYLRKTCNYGFYIPWSNLLLIYGKRFLSATTLRKISDRRNLKIQSVLRPVLEEAAQTESGCMEQVEHASIWFCWFQGEHQMPDIVQLCLKSVRKNANGHPVVVLTRDNYQNYVSMPDIVLKRYEEGALKQAHFADILRIHLLAQQGGVWLDATLLLTKPLPEDFFKRPFYTIKTGPEGNFVSQCRWAVFCLASWKGNPLFVKLARAFEIYLQHTDVFVDYFMFDQFVDMLYQRDETIRGMIDDVPYNNGKVHQLNDCLCNVFDKVQWENLSADTYLFKLSWKSYSSTQLMSNPESCFAYLNKLL